MYEIVEKNQLGPNVFQIKVKAPAIAEKRKPGQFVILRVNEKGERIPLTMVESDTEKGTITLIFQVVGKTTKLLSELGVGDCLKDLVGPLGKPTEIKKYGTVLCVGGGIGTAVAYPIAKAMKECGNKIISIIGARTKELLILEDLVREVSDEVIITTDDGSYGIKGLVTDGINHVLDRGDKVDLIIAIGPPIMMKVVSELGKSKGIPVIVSLNPIMVDGTGMCGACRVEVDGETKFACVDGPEFDGWKVNFDLLMKRLNAYREYEKQIMEA